MVALVAGGRRRRYFFFPLTEAVSIRDDPAICRRFVEPSSQRQSSGCSTQKMYKFHVYVNSMCMSFQCDVFFFLRSFCPHEGPLVQSCFTGQPPGTNNFFTGHPPDVRKVGKYKSRPSATGLAGHWRARRGKSGQGGGLELRDVRPSCGGEKGLQTTGRQRRTLLRRG